MSEERIKILWLAASPRDRPEIMLSNEYLAINEALSKGDSSSRFEFIPEPAISLKKIQDLLLSKKPHIVHFSGHGNDSGELVFVDELGQSQPVSAEMIEQLFSVLKDNIRCVILSACYTDQQAAAIANHVDCVIGMTGEVPDESARDFAIGFYGALGFGRDLKTAFELGKFGLGKIKTNVDKSEQDSIAKLLTNRIDPGNVILAMTDEIQRARAKQLEQFAIPLSELDRNLETFHAPSRVKIDDYLPEATNMVWIIGPPGIGKRTIALCLARKVVGHDKTRPPSKPIYSMSRFENWTRLEELDLRDTVLLLPDALGSVVLERDQIEKELPSLLRLIKKGNTIFVTSPEDVYTQALEIMPSLEKMFPSKGKILKIGAKDYQDKDKKSIYDNLLEYALKNGIIKHDYGKQLYPKTEENDKPTNVIIQCRELFTKRLRETWLPIDLDRFVFSSLTTVTTERDLLVQLQREADIEHRVQAWFFELDENTRCFILTLSIFLGCKESDLWFIHRQIISHLKTINSSLALLPIGVLRNQAAPYVTQSNMLDFTNANVYRTVVKIIVRNYREYLGEILPLLIEWSAPQSSKQEEDGTIEGSSEEDDSENEHSNKELNEEKQKKEDENRKQLETKEKKLQATELYRKAITRFVGEAAKHDLESVLTLLDAWAKYPYGSVARSAGIALRETATDPLAVRHVLNLLHHWATNFSGEDARFYRWSASSALWRLGLIKTEHDLQEVAINYLQKLARDQNEYVRSSVIYATDKLAGTIPLSQLKTLVEDMALAKWKIRKERNVARKLMLQVIDHIFRVSPEQTIAWFDPWLSSDSAFGRWCAIGSLLSCRNLPENIRYPKILQVVQAHPADFSKVLSDLLQSDESNRVKPIFDTLIAEKPSGYRPELIQALRAASTDLQMDINKIRSMFVSVNDPRLQKTFEEMEFDIWHARLIAEMGKTSSQELLNWLISMYTQDSERARKVLSKVAQPGAIARWEVLTQKLADGAREAPATYLLVQTQLAGYNDPTINQLLSDSNKKRPRGLFGWLRRLFGID